MDVYRKKILIVDDDTEILLFLGSRLTNLGYKIFLASNGKNLITGSKEKFISLMMIFGQLNLLKLILKRLGINMKDIEKIEDLYFN